MLVFVLYAVIMKRIVALFIQVWFCAALKNCEWVARVEVVRKFEL
jgi:hypothetical protein